MVKLGRFRYPKAVNVTSIHAFSEKVALVTDGTTPIGKAVALQLALQGAFVIVGVPPSGKGDPAIEALRALGTLAFAVDADARSPDGARTLLDKVETEFARLDLLVNCLKSAGESTFLVNCKDDALDYFPEGVRPSYLVTKLASRLMSSRPKPKIVNVIAEPTSESGDSAVTEASYSADLDTTEWFSRNLPDSFRVNAVVVKDANESDYLDHPEFLRPKGTVSPDDVARVVLFLLSPEAVAVNGNVLRLG